MDKSEPGKEAEKQGVEVPTPPAASEGSFWDHLKAFFWDKIAGSVVLLLLSGGVVFLFQQHYQYNQKEREEAAAVSRIQTEILVKQRGVLLETMGQYFQLLEEFKDRGSGQADMVEELRKLRKKVLVGLYTIDSIDKRIKKEAEPLLQAMNKVSTDLVTKNPEPEEIQKMSEKVREIYLHFLGKLGEITKEVVIRESRKDN
jgi:hypothetical protein